MLVVVKYSNIILAYDISLSFVGSVCTKKLFCVNQRKNERYFSDVEKDGM